MKKVITLSLDSHIVKKLKTYKNKSDIVNDVLTRFFENKEDALTARNETLVKIENELHNISKGIYDNGGLLLNLSDAIDFINYKLKKGGINAIDSGTHSETSK